MEKNSQYRVILDVIGIITSMATAYQAATAYPSSWSDPRAGTRLVSMLLLLLGKNFAFCCEMFYVQGQIDSFL